jgi:hypothetical protein
LSHGHSSAAITGRARSRGNLERARNGFQHRPRQPKAAVTVGALASARELGIDDFEFGSKEDPIDPRGFAKGPMGSSKDRNQIK